MFVVKRLMIWCLKRKCVCFLFDGDREFGYLMERNCVYKGWGVENFEICLGFGKKFAVIGISGR